MPHTLPKIYELSGLEIKESEEKIIKILAKIDKVIFLSLH